MAKKGLARKIAELMYPTGHGYDNVELAKMFLGNADEVSQTKVRNAFTQLRRYGFRVVKQMYAENGKVQRCKYHIVEGVAEEMYTRRGRPPFHCLQ